MKHDGSAVRICQDEMCSGRLPSRSGIDPIPVHSIPDDSCGSFLGIYKVHGRKLRGQWFLQPSTDSKERSRAIAGLRD